jgi:hypothetical protein
MFDCIKNYLSRRQQRLREEESARISVNVAGVRVDTDGAYLESSKYRDKDSKYSRPGGFEVSTE